MKFSTKLADSCHILLLIYINESINSNQIAESLNSNPSFVRQIITKLKANGIVSSVKGHAMYKLTRNIDDITLFDVYKACDGKNLIHLDTHTSENCGVGKNIQYSLSEYFAIIQDSALKKMKEITLLDIYNSYKAKINSHFH